MNVVEAYRKKVGHLIILISGLSGTGKTHIAEKMAKELNLKFLNLINYYNKNNVKDYVLRDGRKVPNWFSVETIVDWDKLNKDIEENKNGVIIVGFGFPKEKIKFTPTIHVNLKTTKIDIGNRRKEFMEKYGDIFSGLNPNILEVINKELVIPTFGKLLSISNVNKFVSIKNIEKDEEIMDILFKALMKLIQDELYRGNSNIKWNNETNKYEIKS